MAIVKMDASGKEVQESIDKLHRYQKENEVSIKIFISYFGRHSIDRYFFI